MSESSKEASVPASVDSSMRQSGESWRIALWMVLLIGISTVPYLVGYWHSSEDWKFTGHLLPVPGDTCFHMSWAKQAAEGEWLFESKHNGATSSTRLVFNVLFLTIGWTSRLLHLPLEMGLATGSCRDRGPAVSLVLYRFTSLFLFRTAAGSGLRWCG